MKLSDKVLIFESDHTPPGVYDQLFSGIFVLPHFQTLLLKALILILWGSGFGLALYAHYKKSDSMAQGALSLLGFAFLGFCFLWASPWDEIFVHLMHSRNLAEHGIFSFSRLRPLEGTVEFLPYFTIGMLGKWGLPLIEMGMLQSLLGSLLCVGALLKILAVRSVPKTQRAIVLALACFFTPLTCNAGTGFGNSLFSATILWSIVFLFFEEKRWKGYFLLSLLPLIRFEGVLILSVLFGAHVLKSAPRLQELPAFAGRYLGVCIPTLSLSIFRFFYFGSPIPLPVQYKQGFDIGYFWVGMRSLATEMWEGNIFLILFLLLAGFFLSPRKRGPELYLLPVTFFCMIPYYACGGDWFPSYWTRYLMPFSVLSFAALALVWSQTKTTPFLKASLAAALLFYAALTPKNGFRHNWDRIRGWEGGRANYRLQELSQIGHHLEKTSEPDAVIASSELATLMYFANRETLDLIGIVNAEIANTPILPGQSVSYRKRKPELIDRYQPEFLWANDWKMMKAWEATPPEKFLWELSVIESKFKKDNEFRFGGTTRLLDLGYRPITVVFGNRFAPTYWVAAHALEKHLTQLRALRFREIYPRPENPAYSMSPLSGASELQLPIPQRGENRLELEDDHRPVRSYPGMHPS